MPYKQKIAVEEKVRIVRECLGHKISISEATRIAGVDFETVKLWINKYENEGVEGFIHKGQKVYTAEMKTAAVIEYLRGGGSYMKQGRDTTKEERLEIVRDCLASGKNYGEMALKYQVSYQQVRTWTLKYEELGEAGLEDRRGKRKKDQTPRTELEAAQIEIEQLKHKLYLAEMENHLLKKLDEIVRRDALDK